MSGATSTASPRAIEFRRIAHRYGRRVVLEDVSCDAAPGEWIALFGESGSGKSTLLRIAAGLERPDQGSVWMLGEDQSLRPAHARPIAWMSQAAGCYEHLSVSENLSIAQRLPAKGLSPGSQDPDAWRAALVEGLGLAPLLPRRPSELSGGERQRAALARALIAMRPILLLDEPLAHLNESLRDALGRRLREWTKLAGTTVVYVTHDSLEAAALADRMVVLSAGRIEQIGAPKSIAADPQSERVAELTSRLRRFYGGDASI